MNHLGEIIALGVAVSWTITALFADLGSHRLGALTLNLLRMILSLLMLSVLLWVMTGSPIPTGANSAAWGWLLLSGVVGYVFGDYCLFNSYVVFGSKFGQLFMTLAPPAAGITGWLFLGEAMSWKSWLAMLVTLSGIAFTILARGDDHKLKLKLPLKGVLFGIGAGVGQGVGLVISKIGLNCYEQNLLPGSDTSIRAMLPFAGTYIRALAGLVGFFLILCLRHSLGDVRTALRDRKGMTYATLTTFFGPFLGVSMSLMAVQYAHAGIASTLMALTPVLIIVPYSILYHQKISPKEVVGTLITMAGVAMFFML